MVVCGDLPFRQAVDRARRQIPARFGTRIDVSDSYGSIPYENLLTDSLVAIQPPAPKHVTDEELKQQYGIHLATRLQADETSKEAKWADIDDDDDDWAPEIIEWNDGTKITLPTLEEQANLNPAKTPVPAPKDDLNVLSKPVQPALSRITSDTVAQGPPKTTNVNSPQPKTTGLVLKGASEKPTLVAKPPASVPVKSPWAPLPPVEKVPPVTIKPQPSQPAERVQREPHGVDSTPPAPSPAKEIAADDFNRSWRDNQSVPNRELFNSQSGRYEPVNDNRRGSTRAEQHFRLPSVLQRPLQSDQKGPAEPSATFQTSRSSAQDVAWGRRRTSSNVSGGSGNLGRRASIGKGQDFQYYGDLYARRGSHQASHPESTATPANSHSQLVPEEYPHNRGRPDQQYNRQHTPQGPLPINAGHANDVTNLPDISQRQQPQGPGADHGPSTQVTQQSPVDDPIAMQRKIMRESRELAMKRRREQEEKEEAEKQERIRKKLEALGPAVLKPEKSEGPNFASAAPVKEGTSPQSPASKLATNPSRSPPKPPVPEVSGEVKQYGMMKVHHPEPVKKPFPTRQQPPKSGSNGDNMDGQVPSSPTSVNNNRLNNRQLLPNGTPNTGRTEGDNSVHQGDKQDSPPDLPRQQPWGKTAADPHNRRAWGGAAMPTRASQISQLWSPAGGERGLGNGTFTGDYPSLANTREPQTTPPQPPSRDPGPIGPPTISQQSSDRRKSPLATENLSQPVLSAPHALNTQSSMTTPSDQPDHSFHSRVGTGFVSSAEIGTVTTAPTSSVPAKMTDRQKALAAWKNLPAQLEAQDAEARLRAVKERVARLEEEARQGTTSDTHQPTFKETWKQVVLDEGRGQRKVVKASTSIVAGGENASTSTKDDHPQLPQSTAAPPVHTDTSLALNADHTSRFFPSATEVSSAPIQRDGPGLVVVEFDPNPPPDSFDHPAYDGDVKHPLVSLPAPKPIVRLPPALTQGPSSEADVTTKVTDSVRSLPRHIEPAPSWQDKIYGLFGRKPSVSTKPQTLTVSSASKAPLEVTTSERSATVSLPVKRSDSGSPTDIPNSVDEEVGSVTSRATDEVLFEEREFGSLPIVKLPTRVPANAWQPARALHNHKVRSRPQKPVQVLSIEPIEPIIIKEGQTSHGTTIEVHIPGVLTMQAFLRTRSNDPPRQRTTSSSSSNLWKNGRRGNKSRETSGNFQAPRSVQGGPLRSNPSIPGNVNNTNNATWARRVSGMV